MSNREEGDAILPIDRLRIEPKPARGRPQKYGNILMELDDHDLYTPAAIVSLAVEKGLLQKTSLARMRVRVTMSRLTLNHQFPREGDGLVTIPGQAPTVGWWGHRWKMYAKP